MRSFRYFALVGLAVLGLNLAEFAAAQSGDWVGKTVFPKKHNTKIGQTDGRGNQVELAKLDLMHYRVLAERDGWIQIKTQHGIAGWFDKNDAVVLENAVGFFTDRIHRNAKDGGAYTSRASAWALKGELDIALKDLDEALRLDPRAYVYQIRGNVWRVKKAYEKAFADYSEAIRLDPKEPIYYTYRGSEWRRKKDFDKAIADYSEAIRFDPKYVDAYVLRGYIWRENKDYDQAIADFNEAIRLDSRNSDAFHGRGLAWHYKNNYDKAVADYAVATRLDPKDDYAFYNLACAHALLGRPDAAIEALRESLRLGYRNFKHMESDTDLDSLRADPRYKQLIQEHNK